MQLSTSILEGMDLDEEMSNVIYKLIDSGLKEEELWEKVCVQVLPRLKNFSKHKLIHSYIFQNWDEKERGPVPWWISKKEQQKNTNLYKFIQRTGELKKQTYEELHRWSVDHYDQFWEDTIKLLEIKFQKPFSKMIESKDDFEAPKWVPGAKLNIADSCFQREDDETAACGQTRSTWRESPHTGTVPWHAVPG